MIIGSEAAKAAPAEHQCKRCDHAKHRKRAPKTDTARQAAPFGDEVGFK